MMLGDVLEYAPIAAAAFATPQFVPQILQLRATQDTAGVSWSWATLTSVNNAAWIVYFALSRYWTALVPASSATLFAGTLAAMLARRGRANVRPAVLIGAWGVVLSLGFTIAGRTGLGTLLTAAFILQVAPSIWTAYRTDDPTGISRPTWMLILAEVSCWTIFGLHKPDPRLITLGATGVVASLFMLARTRRRCGDRRSRAPGTHNVPRSCELPINRAHQPSSGRRRSPERRPAAHDEGGVSPQWYAAPLSTGRPASVSASEWPLSASPPPLRDFTAWGS